MSKTTTPTSIRIPTYLREWLKDRATNNSRSVNGELIELMKKTKEKEETEKPDIKKHLPTRQRK